MINSNLLIIAKTADFENKNEKVAGNFGTFLKKTCSLSAQLIYLIILRTSTSILRALKNVLHSERRCVHLVLNSDIAEGV
jgi:hypothetical protein